MSVTKNAAELEGMRESGRIAARVRDALVRCVVPGVTTRELGDRAAALIRGFGAESAFLGYKGYPGTICVSVNETVVHGIPGDRRIAIGDLVSLDIGVRFRGFVGDTAVTVLVGVADPAKVRLVRTAERALAAGIAAARVGNRVSDISRAVQQEVEAAGFSVVRRFVGHGVGRQMHEEPEIPNFVTAGRGAALKAGMTLAIEPMVNEGGSDVDVLADGWTVVTSDGLPSAHAEHTVAVCDGNAEILTA
jgi:methionyl aminopeptidase